MMYRQGCNSDGELLRGFYVERESVDVDCSGDAGMTRQEFKDECDINVLLAGYERTGIVSHINPREPLYLDTTNLPDLQGALDIYERANASFMSLPAAVRKEFDNDPLAFISFAEDKSNLPKLREWGLAAPEKPADAIPASPPSEGTTTPV